MENTDIFESQLAELRKEIDAVDEELLALIGRRFELVREAARFKRSESDIVASSRVSSMLSERRTTAQRLNIPSEIVERIFLLFVEKGRDIQRQFLREARPERDEISVM